MSSVIRCLSESEWWAMARVVERLPPGSEQFLLVDFTPLPSGWKPDTLRNACAFWLMGDAGFRVAEMLRLRVRDLYVGDDVVRTIEVTAEVGKGGRRRALPVSNNLGVAIHRLAWIQDWKNSLMDDKHVFTGRHAGAVITSRRMQQIIAEMGFVAIQRLVTPHQLRHTFATRLRRRCRLPVVQALLGHVSLKSTQVYMNVGSDDIQSAIENIDASLVNGGDRC